MLTQAGVRSVIARAPLAESDERYADRVAAGRQLAQLLLPNRDSRALVLALPGGSVVVAGEVARTLRLPLDVLIVREIVIRPYPALVAGALSEGGGLCINRALFRLPGATLGVFWRAARRTAHEIATLVERYRQGRSLPALQRHSVILVDDGLGTGLMQLAAIKALQYRHVARCIVATPYATPAALQRVARRADQVLALASGDTAQADGQSPWCYALDDTTAAALVESYQQKSGHSS
jgi:putative phosphoribosyl transferase